MTADYFASLAARAVHPERGIQPRRTTIFDAPSAAPGAGGLRQPPADAATHDGAFALDESVRPAPGSLSLGRAMQSRSTAPMVDDSGDGTRADAPRGRQPDEPSVQTSPGERPALAGTVGPAPPLQPLAGRVATSTPALDTRGDRGRHVIDVVASVRRASASNVAEGAGTRRGDEGEAVVRVHIGRVDVRAVVQAPAPTPVPRASKPDLMSLDEYVQQRRERRP